MWKYKGPRSFLRWYRITPVKIKEGGGEDGSKKHVLKVGQRNLGRGPLRYCYFLPFLHTDSDQRSVLVVDEKLQVFFDFTDERSLKRSTHFVLSSKVYTISS